MTTTFMTRTQLKKIIFAAIAETNLTARTREALPRSAPHMPVHVIAIGKAAPQMALGALEKKEWNEAITRVVIVTTDGTDVDALLKHDKRVEILRAAHPIPDERSVCAADRCLAIANGMKNKAFVLALISGGASALVCKPKKGVTLAKKRGVTAKLLASGATIQEINAERKRLSAIKGGGLARAAKPMPVLTLAASDVIGGTLGDIGSGPTVTPPRKAGAAGKQKGSKIIASPEELAKRVAKTLKAKLLPPSQAPLKEIALEYSRMIRDLKPGKTVAVVRAAEPSLVIPPLSAWVRGKSAGKGGRCTHLVALISRQLNGHDIKGVFAAVATDGVDGKSGTGGVIIDEHALGSLTATDLAITNFNTASLYKKSPYRLEAHPTGNNLTDLHVLLVTRAQTSRARTSRART